MKVLGVRVFILYTAAAISYTNCQDNDSNTFEDKYCPKVQPCPSHIALRYDITYRCARDEVCPEGYKCCESQCYIHNVCVVPVDKIGKEIIPPDTSASSTVSTTYSEVFETSTSVLTTKVQESSLGSGEDPETQKPTSTTLLPTTTTLLVTTTTKEPSTKMDEDTTIFHTSEKGESYTSSIVTTTTTKPTTIFTTKIQPTTLDYLSTKFPLDGSGDRGDDDDSDDGDFTSTVPPFKTKVQETTSKIITTNSGPTTMLTTKIQPTTLDYLSTKFPLDGSGDRGDDDDSDDGDFTSTVPPFTTKVQETTSKIITTNSGPTTMLTTKIQHTTSDYGDSDDYYDDFTFTSTFFPFTPTKYPNSVTTVNELSTKVQETTVTPEPTTIFTTKIQQTTSDYLSTKLPLEGSGNRGDDEDGDSDKDYDDLTFTSTVLPFTTTKYPNSIKVQETTAIPEQDESSAPRIITANSEPTTTTKIQHTTLVHQPTNPPLNKDEDDQDGSGDDHSSISSSITTTLPKDITTVNIQETGTSFDTTPSIASTTSEPTTLFTTKTSETTLRYFPTMAIVDDFSNRGDDEDYDEHYHGSGDSPETSTPSKSTTFPEAVTIVNVHSTQFQDTAAPSPSGASSTATPSAEPSTVSTKLDEATLHYLSTVGDSGNDGTTSELQNSTVTVHTIPGANDVTTTETTSTPSTQSAIEIPRTTLDYLSTLSSLSTIYETNGDDYDDEHVTDLGNHDNGKYSSLSTPTIKPHISTTTQIKSNESEYTNNVYEFIVGSSTTLFNTTIHNIPQEVTKSITAINGDKESSKIFETTSTLVPTQKLIVNKEYDDLRAGTNAQVTTSSDEDNKNNQATSSSQRTVGPLDVGTGDYADLNIPDVVEGIDNSNLQSTPGTTEASTTTTQKYFEPEVPSPLNSISASNITSAALASPKDALDSLKEAGSGFSDENYDDDEDEDNQDPVEV